VTPLDRPVEESCTLNLGALAAAQQPTATLGQAATLGSGLPVVLKGEGMGLERQSLGGHKELKAFEWAAALRRREGNSWQASC